MRFVPPAGTRDDPMDQFRRDRASAPALRAIFPAIEQLHIEMRFEAPSSSAPTAQSHSLFPPARAFFEYRCPHWDCDGHFALGDAVRAALADATHRAKGVLECHGSRIGDRASRRPCLLRLFYEVTATLKHNG